jgi:transposase
MPTGKASKAEVMEQTKVTLATFKRFVVETKKEASTVWKLLNDLGITYVTGKGKNAETYFNKVKQVQ